MAETHFERLVNKQVQATLTAMRGITLGDSHKLAYLQGLASGLDKSLELFREATKTDIDQDAA
jgi:hypothetical protein